MSKSVKALALGSGLVAFGMLFGHLEKTVANGSNMEPSGVGGWLTFAGVVVFALAVVVFLRRE